MWLVFLYVSDILVTMWLVFLSVCLTWFSNNVCCQPHHWGQLRRQQRGVQVTGSQHAGGLRPHPHLHLCCQDPCCTQQPPSPRCCAFGFRCGDGLQRSSCWGHRPARYWHLTLCSPRAGWEDRGPAVHVGVHWSAQSFWWSHHLRVLEEDSSAIGAARGLCVVQPARSTLHRLPVCQSG